MTLDLLLTPIAQYGFLALALIGCLTLFLSMKMEIAAVRRALDENRDAAQASTAARAAELAALAAELSTLRREAGNAEAELVCTGQDLNLTRRAQALRMQRRGESPATITAALRLPRNEIELLLKVERLTNDNRRLPETDRSELAVRSA